jgi:pyruvyl transferase EpsO
MKISKHLKIGQDKGNLFIKRNDVELAEMAKYYIVPNDVEVKDWPLVESQRYLPVRIECVLERWIRNILGKGTACKFADIYWQNILRRYCVNMAIDFLKDRRTIYSTRMHAVILSVILGKQDIYVFDNSYGKISSFIDCWLNDVDVVKLI